VTGRDVLADAARLTIRGAVVTADASHGDSIAVNGVCLTVAELLPDGRFTADVMAESLNRSNLGELQVGSQVNLERAAAVNSRLGGHIVQGHVDGTGQIVARTPSALGGGADRDPRGGGPLRRGEGVDHRGRDFVDGVRAGQRPPGLV